MWRPEGWENPFEKQLHNERIRLREIGLKESQMAKDYQNASIAYEAGADAMLEALKENPHDYHQYYDDAIEILPDWKYRRLKGKWVFIPEEI